MYSLHLTGSPWFLLLIPPGLWILWRQYRGVSAAGGLGGFPRAAGLLGALQSLALILLAFSLTAPEIRRHRVEFHNPAVLILRDQSGSFRAGAYLGLGARYRDFEAAVARAYGDRKFDIKVIDFAETAWPVAGFAKPGRAQAAGAEGMPLTSLAALADYVDSLAIPNLQAAFLFSDGRANLDSGRAPRTWSMPLFPVIFPADSIAEAQPDRVELSADPQAPGGAADVRVAWHPVGRRGSDPVFKLLQGGKTLLTRKLPAPAGSGPGSADSAGQDAAETFRFAWTPDRPVLQSREPLRAVLQPAEAAADFDPFNDTVPAAYAQGRAERSIHVYKPVHSLDERGMLGILQAWEGTRVGFFASEDLGRLALSGADQVWVDAEALRGQGRLQAWLQASPAKVVIYSRQDTGGNPQVPETGSAWRRFPPASEVKAGKAAAEAFPDEVVRLKSLTGDPVAAPERSGDAWVEVADGGKHGMLMGRVPLGRGKTAFFFCLPAIWDALFDPQGDFATRENIAEYVKSAQRLGDMEDRALRILRPGRAYAGVPFDLEVRLPEGRDSGSEGAAAPVLSVSDGAGYAREWPIASAKGISLAAGRYRLEVKAGKEALGRDSLEVSPKEALELARIGFDRPSLEEAASRSGGHMLAPAARASGAGEVTSMLPTLPDAQVRMEKTSSIRLYNTLAGCLAILLLLSLSWLLRKKWDLD